MSLFALAFPTSKFELRTQFMQTAAHSRRAGAFFASEPQRTSEFSTLAPRRYLHVKHRAAVPRDRRLSSVRKKLNKSKLSLLAGTVRDQKQEHRIEGPDQVE
jgi:hypothetical protein